MRATSSASRLQQSSGAIRILREHADRKTYRPFFQFYNPNGIYALRYQAEHAPNRDSRITLSEKCDPDSVPLARVDLRFSELDINSVVAAHQVLEDWLKRRSIGTLDWYLPREQLSRQVRAFASDGYHQIGTTRMAASPTEGVVDRDLRVFGVRNLYVASASVLPVSSRGHPTFPAVTLAVRLADHLRATGPNSIKATGNLRASIPKTADQGPGQAASEPM